MTAHPLPTWKAGYALSGTTPAALHLAHKKTRKHVFLITMQKR